MKFRKKIATLLVAALVMTMLPVTMLPTTVLAADQTSLSDNSVSGNISGNVNYVDTTVFVVTLPTTSSLDFVLDPQGLSGISANQVVSANDLTPGVIVGTNDMYAVNRSSVPIKISAKFSLTDSAKASSTVASVVSSNTDVTASGNEIYMEILTGTQKGISANDYISSNYVSANDGKAIDSTVVGAPTEIVFQLNSAAYSFKNTGSTAAPTYAYIISTTVSDNYDAVYMKLGGKVSADGDWSDFTTGTATLQLNAVFTFSELTDYVSGANDSTAHGLVANATLLKEAVAGPQTVTFNGTADVVINTEAAATLVTYKKSAATSTIAAENYTAAAKTLTIKKAWLTNVKTAFGVGTYTIYYTVNGTVLTATLTIS